MKVNLSLLISYQRAFSTALLNAADLAASSVSMKQLGRLLYGEQNADKYNLNTVYRFSVLRWLFNDAVRISD
jgi:hypothetical protein